MKAYKDAEGHIRLFRPDMNMDRLNRSSSRLGMPVSCLIYQYEVFSLLNLHHFE
jgi:branched-subunit amino acid aminotransferase/4-amino-4-deoxychorismate lyase